MPVVMLPFPCLRVCVFRYLDTFDINGNDLGKIVVKDTRLLKINPQQVSRPVRTTSTSPPQHARHTHRHIHGDPICSALLCSVPSVLYLVI